MAYFNNEQFDKEHHLLPNINGVFEFPQYVVKYSTGHYICFDHITPTNYRHCHDFYEFCLVISGQGIFKQGNESYPLSRGSLFMANPSVYHEISSFKTNDLKLVFFSFSVEELTYKELEQEEDIIIRHFLQDHIDVLQGQNDLFHYLPLLNNSNHRFVLKAFILECLNRLSLTSGVIPNQSEDKLQAIIHYIHCHLHEKLTAPQLASRFYISERHLRRIFKEAYHCTLHEFIQQEKMNVAYQHLSMGFKIQDVAESIGINDSAYFSRCFKKTYGLSPKAFTMALKCPDITKN